MSAYLYMCLLLGMASVAASTHSTRLNRAADESFHTGDAAEGVILHRSGKRWLVVGVCAGVTSALWGVTAIIEAVGL